MKITAIFDIGKTNKKLLLFDESFKLVDQFEEPFPTITDEDGFECDDIDRIENWIVNSVEKLVKNPEFDLQKINFATYGATLVHLDKDGKRLTPAYNYLKEIDPAIQSALFNRYGGEEEFCRKTASPALGVLLNSGIQLLWLKKEKPELFEKIAQSLHLPQYLSYLLTGRKVSELTSIGCHTFMWDFDKMDYHQWLADEIIELPEPLPNDLTFDVEIEGQKIKTGTGIHDSSSSIVPYIKGIKEKFILLSTGTWCISMNPFNDEVLTAEELRKDCLNYLSIRQKPVKSSRLFMGHIHDMNVERMTNHFQVENDVFKKVKFDIEILKDRLSFVDSARNGEHDDAAANVFFKNGISKDYIDNDINYGLFKSFEEAYHQFIFDLTEQLIKSIQLVIPRKDDVASLIVSGGFARNEIFVNYLAARFPDKKVMTSEIDNATALGAALAISDSNNVEIDLGLKLWKEIRQ